MSQLKWIYPTYKTTTTQIFSFNIVTVSVHAWVPCSTNGSLGKVVNGNNTHNDTSHAREHRERRLEGSQATPS
jgi:hypothetical protein